ncbi:MAG TPA: hypothetical protein VGC41_26390 [Kofleriaceae bacterium]
MRTALALILWTASAHAEVDWARGVVTANGVGIADRHAPNPTVARGTSRRGAEDVARARLAKSVLAVPVAAGGTVGDAAKDPAVKARIDRAVAQAIAITADPQTDGAWTVTMAVPIEALRQAIAGGPRTATSDAAPPVAILDAKPTPAIGAAPMLWVKALPTYAKAAPHVSKIETDATLYLVVY